MSSVYAFTDVRPDTWIYATGSTRSRTRLYQMGISKYLDDVKNDFLVYGQFEGEWEIFDKGRDYTAFLVRRK